MTKPSRKHHYLPRRYLRGFADSEGGFFVYDKLAGKIFPTSPDAAFFENHLNTVTLPDGSSSDFLEKLYTETENEAWESLDEITHSTPDAPIAVRDKMDLFLFLSFLHWRLPGNAVCAEQLSQRFFGHDEKLGYFKMKSTEGTPVPEDVIHEIRTSPSWSQTARLIIPFAPFFAGSTWYEDLDNWRFVYAGDGGNWHIVGDNPIITRGDHDHDPVNCLREFIFPVSGRILLMSRGERLRSDEPLAPEFILQHGTAIIERAQRFVACHDRGFLSALVAMHGTHVRFGKTERIVPELFEMLTRV